MMAFARGSKLFVERLGLEYKFARLEVTITTWHAKPS